MSGQVEGDEAVTLWQASVQLMVEDVARKRVAMDEEDREAAAAMLGDRDRAV